MSNSKPIPLFKFPVLVREVIVELLSIDDTFILALCSRRCYRVLQYAIRKNKHLYQLKLCFGNYWDEYYDSHGVFRIDIPSLYTAQIISLHLMKEQPLKRGYRDEEEEEPFSGVIGETPFVGIRGGSFTRTYWNNTTTGMKALIVHISDLFDKPVSISIFHRHQLSLIRINPLPSLDLLNERQRTIPSATVVLCPRDEIFKPIIDRLNSVEDLDIRSDMTTCPFKYVKRNWEHKTLKFGWAPWIQPVHLLKMNCNRIEIESCVLRYEKLSLFLKAWINGAVPRLEHLTIGSLRTQDWNGIFKDIPHRSNPNRVLTTVANETERDTIAPVDVLRSDGAVGTVFYSKLYVEFRGGWRFQFDFVVSK